MGLVSAETAPINKQKVSNFGVNATLSKLLPKCRRLADNTRSSLLTPRESTGWEFH